MDFISDAFLTHRRFGYKLSRCGDIPLKTAATKYALNALVVIGAAIFPPRIGTGIAEQTGLGQL